MYHYYKCIIRTSITYRMITVIMRSHIEWSRTKYGNVVLSTDLVLKTQKSQCFEIYAAIICSVILKFRIHNNILASIIFAFIRQIPDCFRKNTKTLNETNLKSHPVYGSLRCHINFINIYFQNHILFYIIYYRYYLLL